MAHPTATIGRPDPPPVPSSGGVPAVTLNSTMGQIGNINTDLDQVLQQEQAATAPLTQQLQRTINEPLPAFPKIDIGSFARAQPRANVDIMQGLGSPMAIMAIFGSLLTRRPLVAALNAATAAMQGYAQGNQEAYQRAEQSWKDNLDLALKQYEMERDAYSAEIQKHGNKVNDILAGIQAVGTQFHDQILVDNAKAGNWATVAQILESRQRTFEAAQAHKDMMDLRHDQFALASRREDDMEVTRAVQRDLGKEKMGLIHNKTADTVKAKSTELQSMSDDLDKAIQEIQTDPTLGGAYGVGRRLIGETVGQVFPGAQDKKAAEFATNIETLQARLTKPFLQAHYFTGNSAEEMEALVKGLNWRDDPTSTVASLQKVKDILDAQIGTISGAVSDVGSQSESLAIGAQVIQNGWIYENQGGQMVPVGPAP